MFTTYTPTQVKTEIESYLKIIDLVVMLVPKEKGAIIKEWSEKIGKIITQDLALELIVFVLNLFDKKESIQTEELKDALNFFFVQKQATGVAPTTLNQA